MTQTLTMIGLYNYDNTLFDGLTLPAGIDKSIAVDEILLRSGEFEVLYTSPDFMKLAITHWGKKHYRTFEKWVAALAEEFDPLHNYDRYEEYTDSRTAQGNESTTQSDQRNANALTSATEKGENKADSDDVTQTAQKDETRGQAISQTDTSNIGSDQKDRNVSAYDASTFQPREQEIGSNTNNTAGNGINTSEENKDTKSSEISQHGEKSEHDINRNELTSSDSSGTASSQTNSNNIEQNTHKAHLYGNIGVTTSTQMLEDFLRVERFCIYEQIADIFVDEFCLMVY